MYVNGRGPSTIPAAVVAVYDSGSTVGGEALAAPAAPAGFTSTSGSASASVSPSPSASASASASAPAPLASFAVSDATLSYSYRYVTALEHHIDKNLPVQPAPFVANDFLLRPRDDDAQSSALPYGLYPDWNSSEMTQANIITVQNDTIQLSKAYRTVGIIRGSASSR
jgi:hypothetical protein